MSFGGGIQLISGTPSSGTSGVTWAGDAAGSTDSSQIISALTGAGGKTTIRSTSATVEWAEATASPILRHAPRTTDAAVTNSLLRAQSAFGSAATNKTGGALLLQGGARTNTTGKRGPVRISMDGTDAPFIELADVQASATSPSRVVSMCLGAAISTTYMPTGSGDGVVFVADAAVSPSVNPNGGFILYSESGEPYIRADNGTILNLSQLAVITWAGDLAGSLNTTQTVSAISGTDGTIEVGANARTFQWPGNDGDGSAILMKLKDGTSNDNHQPLTIQAGDYPGGNTGGDIRMITGQGGSDPGLVSLWKGGDTGSEFMSFNPADGIVRVTTNPGGEGSIVVYDTTNFGSAGDAGTAIYFNTGTGETSVDNGNLIFGAGADGVIPTTFLQTANFVLGIDHNESSAAETDVSLRIGSPVTDIVPKKFDISGSAAVGPTNVNGGNLLLMGGARLDTTGKRGRVGISLDDTPGNYTKPLIEVGDVQASGTSPSRFVALLFDAPITTTQMQTGTGDKVLFLANCAVAPTTNPVGGVLIYAQGGALKARGTSGTVTTLGAA